MNEVRDQGQPTDKDLLVHVPGIYIRLSDRYQLPPSVAWYIAGYEENWFKVRDLDHIWYTINLDCAIQRLLTSFLDRKQPLHTEYRV